MSRAVAAKSASVEPFENVLESAEELAKTLRSPNGPKKLVRAASAMQRLKDVAYEEGQRQGYEAGYQEGLEKGSEKAYGEVKDHVAQFAAGLDTAAVRVDSAIEDWYRSAEENLASLATAVAARIVGKELQADPELVRKWARESIAEVLHADNVRIRVNPYDSPVVRKHVAEIQAAAPSVKRVEIVDDPSVEGGCRIESDGGVIDATIREQLELALKALRGEP